MDIGARDADDTARIRERVREAASRKAPLAIRGSGSKDFLGIPSTGEPLDVRGHAGIVTYSTGELVVTARAGTRLADLEARLAEHAQMLAFEPPHFGPDATLGGTIACALSGPRRASAGAARDFVLGARIVDGRGEVLRFGGEVIKNVAGYDLSRLMTGAFGTLGVLLDVSIRVVPQPRAETTRALEIAAQPALDRVRAWACRPWPISATAIVDGRLHVRLSGADSAVRNAANEIGGESTPGTIWAALREQTHAFFADPRPLWRHSVAAASPLVDAAAQLIEWNGAQRWLKSDADAAGMRTLAVRAGGHATLFRAGNATPPSDGVFHPLAPALLALHRRLKAELDPHAIFNRGRLYPEL